MTKIFKPTTSDEFNIVSTYRKNPLPKTIEKLAKDYGCEFGDITRIIAKFPDIVPKIVDLREANKQRQDEAEIRHREQRQENTDRKAEQQITKVLEAKRGKPFTLKILDEKGIVASKLKDAQSRRRKIVAKAKSAIYDLRYQDFVNDGENSREAMLQVDEEKRINVNRLHFLKCKRITPWILDNQLFTLTLTELKPNSTDALRILCEEDKTKAKLQKYIGRKDTLISFSSFPNKEGIVYADLFIQIPSPQSYDFNGFVLIKGDTKESKYIIKFLNIDGHDLVEPYIINPKSWAEHERELQRKSTNKFKELIDENTDAEDLKKKYDDMNKASSLEGSNFIKNKIRFVTTKVIEKIKSIPDFKPIFVIPFVDFPLANSENKDWNFIQNKKLYISKVKEVLTGKAWRNGLEVIQLSPEDSKLVDEGNYRGLHDLCQNLLTEAYITRDQQKKSQKLKLQMATWSKRFKKEHGRKPTNEEKEKQKELFKVLDGDEGKPEPSNATLNGESSVPNSSCNPSSPITDYHPSEKTKLG